jgi:hypothetical protein
MTVFPETPIDRVSAIPAAVDPAVENALTTATEIPIVSETLGLISKTGSTTDPKSVTIARKTGIWQNLARTLKRIVKTLNPLTATNAVRTATRATSVTKRIILI